VEDADGEEFLVSIDMDACSTLQDVRKAVAREARNVVDYVADPHVLDLYLEDIDELIPFNDATMDEVRDALSLRLRYVDEEWEDGETVERSSRKKKKRSKNHRKVRDEV